MSELGRRGGLAIGIEETAGVTCTLTFIPYLSVGLNDMHTPIADVAAKGMRDEQGNDSTEGKKWGEGTIEVVLDPATAPFWLGMAMGDISSTTSGAYEVHTLERNTSAVPLTATIYRHRGVDGVEFPYSVANSLELSFADDVAKLSIDILSRHSTAYVEAASYVDLDLITFQHAYVYLTETGGAVSSTLKIREFTLNINNNAETRYAPNDNDVESIVCKNFGVSGNMVIDFETTTQKIAFRDLSKQAVEVIFTKGTHMITITIPQFRVDPLTIDTPNDDISTETINFIAEYDATTTSTIRMSVENNTPLYDHHYTA